MTEDTSFSRINYGATGATAADYEKTIDALLKGAYTHAIREIIREDSAVVPPPPREKADDLSAASWGNSPPATLGQRKVADEEPPLDPAFVEQLCDAIEAIERRMNEFEAATTREAD